MINQAILYGLVGKDPTVKTDKNGKKFAYFSLATKDGWGDKAKTNWHNVLVFDKQAEFVSQFVKKGDAVLIEGHIDYDDYTGNDGKKITTTRIVADKVNKLWKPGDKLGEDDLPY